MPNTLMANKHCRNPEKGAIPAPERRLSPRGVRDWPISSTTSPYSLQLGLGLSPRLDTVVSMLCIQAYGWAYIVLVSNPKTFPGHVTTAINIYRNGMPTPSRVFAPNDMRPHFSGFSVSG